MVVFTNSWRMWMVGMAVSLAIFGVVYFTVIKPSSDTANQAIKSGLQQSQQALNQAQKQITGATSQPGAPSTQVPAVSKSAQQQINKATNLASCVAAAGTDVTKIQACKSQAGK